MKTYLCGQLRTVYSNTEQNLIRTKYPKHGHENNFSNRSRNSPSCKSLKCSPRLFLLSWKFSNSVLILKCAFCGIYQLSDEVELESGPVGKLTVSDFIGAGKITILKLRKGYVSKLNTLIEDVELLY